jgi:hypothetical protein
MKELPSGVALTAFAHQRDKEAWSKARGRFSLLVLLVSTVMALVVAGGAAADGSPYAASVLADNPLVYYRMADPGPTMVDASPNNHNGGYWPGAVLGQPSALGEASDFSVSSSWTGIAQQIIAGPLPSGDSARTVEAWYKSSSLATPAGQSGKQTLVTWGESHGGGGTSDGSMFEVSVTPDGLNLDVWNGTARFAASIQDGNWHHLAFVYDPTASPRYAGYLDGTALTLSAVTDHAAEALHTDGSTWLDVGSSGCCAFLNGWIDEVAIYGTALSADQLRAHSEAVGGTDCPIAVPSTPPNSANTCVTADVVSTITVTAPALVSFGSLAVGETGGPAAAPVNVKSNAGGYQLSVTRTAFTNGDLPLAIQSAAPPEPEMLLDLSGLTAIPTSGSVDIGHRSGSITPDAGDTWPLSLVLGPVPATATGTHASIVTFTAVAF